MSILERHADKWTPLTETGCFLWTGALTGAPGLRPMIRIGGRKGKNYYVSRLVCEEERGPPSSRREAAHNTPNGCIGGLCVNPAHLRWATGKENSSDEPRHLRSLRTRKGIGMVYDLPYHVTFDKANNKYRVMVDGRHVGRYSTVEEAVDARDECIKGLK